MSKKSQNQKNRGVFDEEAFQQIEEMIPPDQLGIGGGAFLTDEQRRKLRVREKEESHFVRRLSLDSEMRRDDGESVDLR